ncbi:hypothetical protein [Aeromicrobium endophyticum]|uniref:Uncharacterized protein n=1 Tax=Aeromicrobium endophyticum TaxID=2292704 RepID=A0A371PE21_9ACTN|nr:hypothetical protein [Aeromicrobium endophyticum]REK73660.1 hypothetical protein DX116_09045 [Aeromicrobium endophyticum]
MTGAVSGVPAEAIEAAARAIYHHDVRLSRPRSYDRWGIALPHHQEACRDEARAALAAALPALREGIAAEVLAPVREVEDRWSSDMNLHAASPYDILDDFQRALSGPVQAAEEVHAYAAAGYLVCGQQTGGNISRVDGYEGPAHRGTTVDADVTCRECRAWLDDMARVAAEEVGGEVRTSGKCATCGEEVYLTVSGPWRHVERDHAHDATPTPTNGVTP